MKNIRKAHTIYNKLQQKWSYSGSINTLCELLYSRVYKRKISVRWLYRNKYCIMRSYFARKIKKRSPRKWIQIKIRIRRKQKGERSRFERWMMEGPEKSIWSIKIVCKLRIGNSSTLYFLLSTQTRIYRKFCFSLANAISL